LIDFSKISNIATQRQQVLNAVQIQEKYIKVLHGNAYRNKIEIPYNDLG
jgi:hypothetical protein